jgi:hypothetical protein
MRVLRLSIVPLALLMLAASGGAQTANKTATDAALIDTERKLNGAFAKGDTAGVKALVADEGIWATGSAGFIPMTLLLGNGLDENRVPDARVENPRVLWADADTGIVLSVWTGSGTALGEPFVTRVSATVWTRRGDKWVAVYHHDSNAPPR